MARRTISNRLRWLLIRSPYRNLVKALRRLRASAAVRNRRAAFAELSLDSDQEQAVESLRLTGYADASAVVERALLEAAEQAARGKVYDEDRPGRERLNPDKDFWEHLLDEDADATGRQPSDSPFVQLAASERVLALVSAYFADAPLVDYVHLLYSTHRPGPLKVSQLWHRDYDDAKVLKLFVYLSDCETDEDGPFTFLPAPASRSIGFSLHSHRPDAAMGEDMLKKHIRTIKGPRLSAFLVDTGRCYHMGSRVAPGHDRLLYVATFTTFPKFNGRPAARFHITSPVSERQRVALTYA